MTDDAMTFRQVAELTGLSVSTLRRAHQAGELTGHQEGENTSPWRFDRAEVSRWYRDRYGHGIGERRVFSDEEERAIREIIRSELERAARDVGDDG